VGSRRWYDCAVSSREPNEHRDDGDPRDVVVPLRKLVELALAHPEIGPPLADLAFAIGHRETGDQLLRMGTDRDNPQLEYFVVAAHAARRTRRWQDALGSTIAALRAYKDAEAGVYDGDDGERLLQLVRTGFGVLMFDLKDLSAEPEFTKELATLLPELEDRLGERPLYRTLLAEALWFADKDASEKQWERARELGDEETVWNARGTWYKEAERDLDKAERAYRKGLEKVGGSGLLMHNLAQVLVERAERGVASPGAARHLLSQAQDLLRRTLQTDVPRLRRHIHATRDRLEAVRRSLPPPEPRPAPEDRQPPPQQQPQERRPEARADRRDDRGPPPRRDDRGPPPRRDDRGPPPPRRDDRRGPPQQQQREQRPPENPGQTFLTKGTVSLADMILAKLKGKG